MTSLLWSLAAAPTLVALAGLVVPGRHRPAVVRLAPLAPLSALPLSLAGPTAGVVDLPWLLLGTQLRVDEVGRALLLVACLLYGAALAGTGGAVAHRRAAFTSFLLACWAGNATLLVAADSVTFYLAFAVMSFAAYGLVVHDRDASAMRAGRVYLVLTVLGELAVLTAVVLAVHSGGRLLAEAPAAVAASPYRDLVVGLVLAGFGVKAGLAPLHVWLPLAHPAAPSPASAVLSGAMVKAGVVGMLRFLPIGEVALPGWGNALGATALAAAFLAVAVGLTQRDAKASLAYSTVSQTGFLLVLVGVALAVPEAAPAASAAVVLYAVHHGLAKGALFLGVGVWKVYGRSPARRWVLGGLAVSALAVAGAPFTGGAAAKYAAKDAAGDAVLAGVDLQRALPLVAVGTTLLLARFLSLLPEDGPAHPLPVAPPGLLAGWSTLVAAGAVLPWLVGSRWLGGAALPALGWSSVWVAAWPVLTGAALLLGVRLLPRGAAPAVHVPPGDVVVLVERGTSVVLRGARRCVDAGRGRVRPPSLHVVARAVERAESQLVGWRASGGAVLVVLLGLGLVLGGR